MGNNDVVAAEVAEAEFQRFVESMDLDVERSGMDADDRSNFDAHKRVFLRAVQRGALVVNEEGEPVYTPTAGDDREPITFHEPRGGDLMSLDQKKAGHDVAKGYGLMAAITGNSAKRFSTMRSRDIKVCSAVLALFLG